MFRAFFAFFGDGLAFYVVHVEVRFEIWNFEKKLMFCFWNVI